MSGYKSGMKGADVLALLKNGLPIVDDVSKLDPNAELGSMASVVTAGSIQEISISELPQPDASIIDETNFVLNASSCPQVSRLEVLVPTSAIPVNVTISEADMIHFTSESIDLLGMSFGTMLGVLPVIQNGELSALMAMYMDVATMTQQSFTLFSITNGVVTADQDAINQVNTLINGLYYVSAMSYVMQGQTISSEVLAVYDMVLKAAVGVPDFTDIYVKGDKWEKLYEKEFTQLNSTTKVLRDGVNGLQTQVSAIKTSYPIVNTTESNILMQPNTYYKCSASNNLRLTFDFSGDTAAVREYVIEINCQTSFTLSLAYVVKWANEIVPVIEAGKTIVISVVNNLAVFAEFV